MAAGSRRDFLRGWLRGAEPSADPAPPAPTSESALPRVIAWLNDPPDPAPPPPSRHGAFPLLRPPGAVREETFVQDCTRCEACIQACPHGALRQAPARFRQAAGTPYIDAAQAPCRLCEDWPCIEACPEGVLVLEGAGAMGTAKVQAHDCLNGLGSTCSVCVERCPVPSAIELRGGRVVVNEAMCTGCGVCHHVCPAPNNAVIMLPATERPEKAPEVKLGDEREMGDV